MEKKIFLSYLNKIVILRTRNGWKWEGQLIKVEDSAILLDDISKGKIWISSENVMTIYERENGRDNN